MLFEDLRQNQRLVSAFEFLFELNGPADLRDPLDGRGRCAGLRLLGVPKVLVADINPLPPLQSKFASR